MKKNNWNKERVGNNSIKKNEEEEIVLEKKGKEKNRKGNERKLPREKRGLKNIRNRNN